MDANRFRPADIIAVYIFGPKGQQYQTNIFGGGIEQAVRSAVNTFLDPWWKGPKPKAGTVLRVDAGGAEPVFVTLTEETCRPSRPTPL